MKHGNSQNGKLPVFRDRLRSLQGDLTTTAFAEKLGLSRQTTGFYINGDRIPDIQTLRQICEKCNVSADYLLGISGIKSPNPQIQDTIELTGLSESTIGTLSFYKQIELHDYANAINALVLDCRYHNYDDANNRDFRPILGLINYFLNYHNSGVQKVVLENGKICDHSNPNSIPTNAIALNDILIENAVLAEIQQALISLKKNRNEAEGK